MILLVFVFVLPEVSLSDVPELERLFRLRELNRLMLISVIDRFEYYATNQRSSTGRLNKSQQRLTPRGEVRSDPPLLQCVEGDEGRI